MAAKIKADTLQEVFEKYYDQRVKEARAMTPRLRLEVIHQLRQEMAAGRIPTRHGVVKVDPEHPAIRGALEGRAVEMDGDKVEEKVSTGAAETIQASSPRTKLLILIGLIGIIAVAIAVSIWLFGRETPSEPVDETALTTQIAPTLVLPTFVPTDLPVLDHAAPPLPTPIPTSTPPVVFTADEKVKSGDNPYDPISIEIAGQAYVLNVGRVTGGLWEPQAPEWLPGNELQRVVALPYDPDLLQAVFSLRPDDEMILYLRSGTAVRYHLRDILRVARNRVDVLADRSPSLAIVFYGEPGSDRWVVLGNAEQTTSETGFTPYVPAPDLPVTAPLPTMVVTTTQQITHDGTTLTVTACQRQSLWQGQPPASEQHQFVMCEIEVTGEPPAFLTITELDWAQALILPNPLIVTDPNIQVVGLVRQATSETASQPVLVWDEPADGVRHIVYLTAVE